MAEADSLSQRDHNRKTRKLGFDLLCAANFPFDVFDTNFFANFLVIVVPFPLLKIDFGEFGS